MLTWRPANLRPGGNTKHRVLVQDYPNRMEIRGEIPDIVKGVIRKEQPQTRAETIS